MDTLGFVIKALVTEADVTERDGAEWLLTALLQEDLPRLKLVWVDGGFSGEEFAQRIYQKCGLTIEVVQRPELASDASKAEIESANRARILLLDHLYTNRLACP